MLCRPYFRDFELEDYLKLHLKGKGNKGINTSKKKSTPYGSQVYKNIRALTAKTRQAINKARNKFKGVAETIPKRLNKGLRKTFGSRRNYIISEDELGDDYYYDSIGEITGPTAKEIKYNDDSAGRVYDYYDEKMLNKYLHEPYYVTENVVVFPKSKPKVPNSPVKRIIQKTKDINHDYNYDYVDGNYPMRAPKKRNKDTFDLSKFYK